MSTREGRGGQGVRREHLRIGYVIGALGRGGAQTQLMELASGMVRRGHDVHVLAYLRPSAFDTAMRATGAQLTVREAASRWQKYRAVRPWLRKGGFDVVHALQIHPASLALVSRWPGRTPPIVVTDFSSAIIDAPGVQLRLLLRAYALADAVITESDVNRAGLERAVAHLVGRTSVIRNGLDVTRFAPPSDPTCDPDRVFRFCVVATVYSVKNPHRVVDAVAALVARGWRAFHVDWYGRIGVPHVEDGRPAVVYAETRGVAEYITFHGDTSDIERAYQRSNALLLASVREGFPNAVAEAMGCGLPVVVSDVSDLPKIVAHARNGFLLDPLDVGSIADAMEKMMRASADERAAMARRSREVAVAWFSRERFLDDHEGLYRRIASQGRPVPATSAATDSDA